MTWTWKSTLLGIALSSVFIAVFGVQVKRVSSEIQEAQWRDSAVRESALVQRLVSERSQALMSSFPFSSFQGESLPEPYSLVVDMELAADGDVRVSDLRRSPEWTLGRDETASILSILRQREYKPKTVYWFLRVASEDSAYRVMAFLGDAAGAGFPAQAAGRRLWAAVFQVNPLERLTDDFLGAPVDLALYDSLGQVLLDARTESLPLEQTAPGWQMVQGMGLYQAEVPGTNLHLLYRVSTETLSFGKASMTSVIFRIGLGILLLGSGLLFWWLRRSPARADAQEHSPQEGAVPEAPTVEASAPEVKVVEVPGPVVRPAQDQLITLADELHAHLWGVLGPIQQLKATGLLPEHQKLLLQMEEHVRPLMGTSDSLRSFLEREEFPAQTLNLTQEIQQVIDARESDWKSADITVVSELEEDCWIRGSSFALRKSLNEIISNSVEAMEGVTPKIMEFSLTRLDDQIRLRVADSGKGLEASVQPLAFEPFVGTKTGRMGLGLAFVKGAVKAMGGAAVFDARPTGGAQVLLTFGAAQPPRLVTEAAEQAAEPQEQSPATLEFVEPELEAEGMDAPVPSTQSVAAEKVPLEKRIVHSVLSDDEAWDLTTLDEELSAFEGASQITLDTEDEEDSEEWSPVFTEVRETTTHQAPPSIRVRPPRRRDLET